jgi:hypothetical protein
MAQSRIERKLNEVRVTDHGRLAVLSIAAAAVAAIVTVTSMTSGELTAAGRAGLPQAGDAAPSQQTSASFAYFPAQYVNQATEASEHIQAF